MHGTVTYSVVIHVGMENYFDGAKILVDTK
jgi:hypothetical protein